MSKHLSAVRSMADKCLLNYAALMAGTLLYNNKYNVFEKSATASNNG
jgi:hypothetical protein